MKSDIFRSGLWTDGRLLTNTKIKQYLIDSIKDEIPNYVKKFKSDRFNSGNSEIFKVIPFFISRSLHSTTNAVVLIVFTSKDDYIIVGHVYIHLKVHNVYSFNQMIDIFSTNNIPDCINKFKIKIIQKNPQRVDYVSYTYAITTIPSELGVLFNHLKESICVNDKIFYTFNEANLYYDFYNTCTILSIDPNNKNNEKLRSFTMDGFYARPSAGMLCLSALYSITSIFRSNTDQPLPIQEEPHELEQTIPENDVPLETEQSQSKKANPVVVQRTRPDHGNYHTLERDSQPQELSSIY